jgi:hypothetical protein
VSKRNRTVIEAELDCLGNKYLTFVLDEILLAWSNIIQYRWGQTRNMKDGNENESDHLEDICKLECNCKMVKAEVKQSHYRPGQAQRVPGVWGYQISRQ